MSRHLDRTGVTGWKSYDFTLMRDADDATILVSDEIIRDYMSYVASCRRTNERSLSFADWICMSPPRATGGVQSV
jgi:hypothetical protein